MPKGKVRLSNWSRRFLTSKQIRYAANDAYVSDKDATIRKGSRL